MNLLQIKNFLKYILPPFIQQIFQLRSKYGFFGNYSSWEIAQKKSSGYESKEILSKVKNSLLKVKNKEAIFERDSVLFNNIDYSFPILSALLKISFENQGNLSVLDFGGSLGSSYYQCREFLLNINNLKWNIVEQKSFVEAGKNFFEDPNLFFFDSIESCLDTEIPDVILLSGVVQYLETPYNFIENILDLKFKNILFDRTAFILSGSDRLTVQKVDPKIYNASYPAWFLNLEKFKHLFADKYNLIFEFESPDKANIPSTFKGFYFQLKRVQNR
jgi:putative methyltransferase (TIGR04325 family)